MLVAVYIRKSRGKEEDLLKHQDQLEALCKNKGYKYDIYKEVASSVDNERIEYTKMKKGIIAGKYKIIVCMALDRLSREKQEQAEISKLISEYNLTIITPVREYKKNNTLEMDITELLARQEYSLIKDRQRNGIINSFEKGNWTGGKPTLGYIYDKNTKELVVDDKGLKIYELIKKLALKGENSTYIAKVLNDKGYKTTFNNSFRATQINRILKCKTYIGMVSYGKKWVQGRHKPLLTIEEFNVIQDFISGRRIGNRSRNKIFPLSGLLRCSLCGALYSTTRRVKRDNKEYLKRCWRVDYDSNIKCENKGIKADIIHQEIKKNLVGRISELTIIINNFNDLEYHKIKKDFQNQIIELEEYINVLKNKNNNILSMCENGLYDVKTAKEKIAFNDNKIIENEIKIKKIEMQINNLSSIDIKKNLKETKKVLEKLEKLDYNNQKNDIRINEIYKTIIETILIKITDEEINIHIQYKQ